MKMRIVLVVASLMGNHHFQAQSVSLDYDTELQTNFMNDYKWCNLLRLDGSFSISRDIRFDVATISIARSDGEPLIDDLQGYSNIEEENLPLGISLLGFEYRNRRSAFFLGIRNVNEDYFTSPVTSLFVNSSCGIFPTVSGNYDIANYPLSSWCFHYKAEWEKLTVKTSLYDGLGHRRIAGHDNVFRFSPSRDGIFSISSVEYDNNGNFSLGCALYYGVHCGDENLVEKETPAGSSEIPSDEKKRMSVTPWLNIERPVTDACSVMIQASYSSSKSNCRYYFGAGAAYRIGASEIGVFADYAKYNACGEIATELTCRVPVGSAVTLQPAVEVIGTGSHVGVVGIARLSIHL